MKVQKTANGYILPVQVLPGSSRNQVRGEYGGRVKLAISAPPEGGKANKALCEFLAENLGVRKSDVHVVAGKTSRLKEVMVKNVSKEKLSAFIKKS